MMTRLRVGDHVIVEYPHPKGIAYHGKPGRVVGKIRHDFLGLLYTIRFATDGLSTIRLPRRHLRKQRRTQ